MNSPSEPTAAGAGDEKRRVWPIVGVGVVVVAVLLGTYLAIQDHTQYGRTEASRLLREAEELIEEGDLYGAHLRLTLAVDLQAELLPGDPSPVTVTQRLREKENELLGKIADIAAEAERLAAEGKPSEALSRLIEARLILTRLPPSSARAEAAARHDKAVIAIAEAKARQLAQP